MRDQYSNRQNQQNTPIEASNFVYKTGTLVGGTTPKGIVTAFTLAIPANQTSRRIYFACINIGGNVASFIAGKLVLCMNDSRVFELPFLSFIQNGTGLRRRLGIATMVDTTGGNITTIPGAISHLIFNISTATSMWIAPFEVQAIANTAKLEIEEVNGTDTYETAFGILSEVKL